MGKSKVHKASRHSCLVSVITIVFNGEELIEETILSVLTQDYTDIEYIVVDGGSNDETIKIINKFRGRINKVISEPDDGIYDAINKGISESTGKLIGIIHCGDYYEPGAVSGAVNKYLETGADAVYGDIRIIESNGTNIITRRMVADQKHLTKRMSIFHPSLFVSRDAYLKYGIYSTDYRSVSDYEFVLRMFNGNAKFVHVNIVLANFRKGGLSSSNLKLSLHEHFKIRKKNISLFNAIKYAMVRSSLFLFYSARKKIIEKIIGEKNYFRIKSKFSKN